jgi:cytidylate kinase
MNGEPMTTIDSLERFLEFQLQTWNRRDEEQKSKRVGPVIAITRQPGCDGESIAQTLAEELGLVLYDWKIVEEIAKDARVSEQVVATLDEKLRSKLSDWLDCFTGGPGLSSDHYMQSLRRVLFAVASHGNAVLLGRGANFLLPPETRTLGLCLVAPLDVRVENIMQKRRLSEKDAREHIARTEREHRLWVRKQGHADITDAINYHIVINTALVATETIVQIVKGIVSARS